MESQCVTLHESACLHTPAGTAVPVMVPLSLPDIRRLFSWVLEKPPLSCLFPLQWSFVRRTHHASARRCHSHRRLAASPSLLL
jgi:hypothetical protein